MVKGSLEEGTIEDTGKLLTVSESENVLGVKRSTIFKLISDGSLRSVKIGSSRRIWTKDLQNYLQGLLDQSTKEAK